MTNPQTITIGLDVAKANFEAAVAQAGQSDVRALTDKPIERSRKGARLLLAAIDATGATLELAGVEARVVMESTGSYSRQLAEWLIEERPELKIAIVNPAFIKYHAKGLGARNKTDKADAKAIACYGAERKTHWYEMPDETLARLRALSRERDALIKHSTQLQNRMQETYDAPREARKAQQALLRTLERESDRLEAAMKKTLTDDGRWRIHYERLLTIPGIGSLTAMVVLAELGDLRRFNRSRQLGAYAGVHPQIAESGKQKPKSHLCKMGNARVRQALYMSAMAVIGKRNALGGAYDRLVSRGKPKLVSLCAISRRQLLIMRSLMIHETTYNDARLCG